MLCGWEMSLRLDFPFCLSSTLILSIYSRTPFIWFLICFWNHAFMNLHISFQAFMLFVFLFGCLVFILFCFQNKNKKENSEKYKNSVCFVYIGTCVSWMGIETKFSKLCISCSLNEHLYAQLSKWALWLLFVMSKIKLSLVLNTHITLFDGKD